MAPTTGRLVLPTNGSVKPIRSPSGPFYMPIAW